MTLLHYFGLAIALECIGLFLIAAADYRNSNRLAVSGLAILSLGFIGAMGLVIAKAVTGP